MKKHDQMFLRLFIVAFSGGCLIDLRGWWFLLALVFAIAHALLSDNYRRDMRKDFCERYNAVVNELLKSAPTPGGPVRIEIKPEDLA